MVVCSHCGKAFKYESERLRHELSHLPGFRCEKCGKKFTYLSALKRHEKQHERTGDIQCDKCNRSFKDETLLKRHLKYAHEGTYTCSQCSAMFNSKQALSIHILTHKPKSERRYSCGFKGCNKIFNFSHHLKYHELTHTNSKQHFCKVCGKGFIQEHNLKVHMKIHEPNKWLPCHFNNCKKKFISEYALKRHQARHKTPIKVEEKSVQSQLKTTGEIQDKSCQSNVVESFRFSPITQEHQINEEEEEKLTSNDIVVNPSLEEIEQQIPNNVRETEEFVTCKSVLGKCLITGDSNTNENCLCDQMINSNKQDGKTLQRDDKQSEPSKFENDSSKEYACKDCSCTPSKSDAVNTVSRQKKVYANNDCMPEFEYGLNGTVKIINTFDIDFVGMVGCDNNNIIKKIDQKVQNPQTGTIPYNSCRAVLGKCIVSKDGMMNEDCLCAKMAFDEPQMTSQEMEEITPQCNEADCL